MHRCATCPHYHCRGPDGWGECLLAARDDLRRHPATLAYAGREVQGTREEDDGCVLRTHETFGCVQHPNNVEVEVKP